MAIPVDDNSNEVLRKAAQLNVAADKYDLRVFTGDLIFGVDYDNIAATYPTTSQEIYTLSLSAATIRTITVDYTDASKKDLLNVAVA